MYANDILSFCKGHPSNIQQLINLFTRYSQASGQQVNNSKSYKHSGSITTPRMNVLLNMIGFNRGILPFTYLGVPIFKGKVKYVYLKPIVDKIISKMTAWKGSSLSMVFRSMLVKTIVQSMLTHTITCYNWPTSLLKDIERASRNFIWSSSIIKRKLVMAS